MDAGDQFARVERLGQVVVGAHFKPDDAVDLVAFGGEHDDRLLRFAGTQAAADRQAIFAWQHQVKNDQFERIARHRLVHRFGVFGRADGEALFRQVALQEIAQALVVVDDEDLSVVHEGVPLQSQKLQGQEYVTGRRPNRNRKGLLT